MGRKQESSEEGQRKCEQDWNHVISGKWQDPFIHALKLAVTVTELRGSEACAFRVIIEPAPGVARYHLRAIRVMV